MSPTTRRQISPSPTSCNNTVAPWAVNHNGSNQCAVLEKLGQLCHIDLGDPGDNLIPDTFVCSSQDSSSNSCCCNVATYALLSACWLCQAGHTASEIESTIDLSYAAFFNNSGCLDQNGSAPFPSSVMPNLIPSWAYIIPQNLSDHWNFSQAEINATSDFLFPSQTLFSSSTSSTIISPTSSSTSNPTPNVQKSISTGSGTPPGTIAAIVIGTFALLALLCTGVWALWKWRRRNTIRPNKGARIDLTESEMQEPTNGPPLDRTSWPKRMTQFPFPFESVVRRYHPDAQYSIEPSRTDEEPALTGSHLRPTRRHTTAAIMMTAGQRPPLDQLELDLADLRGSVIVTNDEPKRSRKERTRSGDKIPKSSRKRATSLSHTGTGSSSSTSRHLRQKSDASKGKYFHLPPSAQYLADIARYPNKVDPERPWDVRHSLMSTDRERL